jgi:hypothetical protein
VRVILEYAKKLRKAADVLEDLFREAPTVRPEDAVIAVKIGQRAAKHLSKKHATTKRPGTKRGDDGLTDRERSIVDVVDRQGPIGAADVARHLGLRAAGVWKVLRRLRRMKVVRASGGLYEAAVEKE